MMKAVLKDLVRQSGFSQKDIAERLHISQQRFNFYVNGQREPDIAMLCSLADFFGVTVDYLLGREEKSALADGGEDVKSVFPEVFIKAYQELNDEGREKVIEYATDLAASGRYRKKADKHEMGKAANE